MKLTDKVAIVTGAGSGIGRAIALRFAKEGANVVVADVDLEWANKVVDEIKTLNSRAIATKTDVKKSREVNQMVKAALDEFGKIDILVNNAGGTARERSTPFHECPEEVWDFVIDTNLKGTLICTRAVLPHMIERRSGKILSTASVAGISGADKDQAGGVEYTAAKAGIIGFTKVLAKQYGQYGIAVNCYSPGPTRTAAVAKLPHLFERLEKRNYLGRLGEPEEIANVAAFLASDEANWVTGQNYVIDGGESLGW